MISLLPSHSETIVTSLSRSEIVARLVRVTANTLQWEQEFKVDSTKIFYGYVHDHHFQVAVRNTRLISFSPLVFGRIEATRTGCILLLDFQLFILTKVMLAFWTIVLIGTSLALLLLAKMILYASLVASAVALLHLIAWGNFVQQSKPTRQAIYKLLEE